MLAEGKGVVMDEDLWCVHVLGPDSLIPQPDYPTAVKRAQEWIAMFRELSTGGGRTPSSFDPIMHCNVIVWTSSLERHAEELARHGGNPEDIC